MKAGPLYRVFWNEKPVGFSTDGDGLLDIRLPGDSSGRLTVTLV